MINFYFVKTSTIVDLSNAIVVLEKENSYPLLLMTSKHKTTFEEASKRFLSTFGEVDCKHKIVDLFYAFDKDVEYDDNSKIIIVNLSQAFFLFYELDHKRL